MSDRSIAWVGIDFGTISCSAAVRLGNELLAVNLGGISAPTDMPTAFFIEDSGAILVGQEAVNARAKDPLRYRDRFKLQIGNRAGITVAVDGRPRHYAWVEVIAAILLRIRRAAEVDCNNGKPITRATITVPALYATGGAEWQAMVEAAAQAGFSDVHVLREPYAAAIYYDHLLARTGRRTDRGADGSVTMIYDLGGGTFDPALIRRGEQGYVLIGAAAAREGVPCGGIVFDERLRQDFKAKCPQAAAELARVEFAVDGQPTPDELRRTRRREKDIVELESFLMKIKHGFAAPGMDAVDTLDPILLSEPYRLSRADFNALIASAIDETIDSCRALMRTNDVAWRDVGRIVMVGGSCHIPLVREKIAEMLAREHAQAEICWRKIDNTSFDPLLAVCFGAALDMDVDKLVLAAAACMTSEPSDPETGALLLRMAADRQHPHAEFYLARCYQTGNGVPADDAAAWHWMERAATHGQLAACCAMAEEWQERWYSAHQIDDAPTASAAAAQAARWVKRAAELGDVPQQRELGRLLQAGFGIERDPAAAARWFAQAAAQGDATAQYEIGQCYWRGSGVDEDDGTALVWMRKAGQQGHLEAQFWVGQMLDGERDYAEALEWYRRAAEQSHPGACREIGTSYAAGAGVEKDLAQARHWYRRAADLGDALGQLRLGRALLYTEPVQAADGFAWLKKAADQGDVDAMYEVGECHFHGRGVAKTLALAQPWYAKAANLGHARAMNDLGWCYNAGIGVAKDLSQAVAWYGRAAEKEDPTGLANLAYMTTYGYGQVGQDLDLAIRLYRRAGAAGRTGQEPAIMNVYVLAALRGAFAKGSGWAANTYVAPGIQSSKSESALSGYAGRLAEDETLLMLYDDTVFGGGKDGIVVTGRGIGAKTFGSSASYWTFDDFDEAAARSVRLAYTGNPDGQSQAERALLALARTVRTRLRSCVAATAAGKAADWLPSQIGAEFARGG